MRWQIDALFARVQVALAQHLLLVKSWATDSNHDAAGLRLVEQNGSFAVHRAFENGAQRFIECFSHGTNFNASGWIHGDGLGLAILLQVDSVLLRVHGFALSSSV